MVAAVMRRLALISAALAFGLSGVSAMQRQEVAAGANAGMLVARPGATLLHREANASEADVCEVVYINLNKSVERREGMEANMQELGIQARRFPAVVLDVVDLPDGKKNFTAESTATLLDIFSDWGCGAWTAKNCSLGDQLCCKGLNFGVDRAFHMIAGFQGSADTEEVPVASYLGNMASHYKILKQMRGIGPTDPCIGTVIMEDDIRLHPQWLASARHAVSLVPDFDIIKLYHNYNENGLLGQDLLPLSELPGCKSACSPAGEPSFCLVNLTVAPDCWRWSNGAWLVNPKSVDKVLEAIKNMTQLFVYWDYNKTEPEPQRPEHGHLYSLDANLAYNARSQLLKMYAVAPAVGYTATVGWDSTY